MVVEARDIETRKCEVCNGTGYRGLNSPPDTPSVMLPIGCWPCEYCQGKGVHPVVKYSAHTREFT
jgi:hypothetical protein